MRWNESADDRPSPALVHLKRAVVLGQPFVQPDRHGAREVVGHHVDVLVENRAQRVLAVSVGERDDIHVVAREEVAAEPDRLAVVAWDVGFEGSRRLEHDDDRRHGGGSARARNHAREGVAEPLEFFGDFADATLAGLPVNDEVGRLDARPLGGLGWRRGEEDAGRNDAEPHGSILLS